MKLPLSYLARLRSGDISKESLVTFGCLNPRELQVVDSASALPRLMFAACGRCPNCRNQRRKEWVSRMCLHSLYWKHVYFVTLTYGSYDLTKFKSHPFLQDWLDTRPVFNSDNSLHRSAWRPTILCRSHLEKFMKRLRFNTGATISTVYCGEYGEDYGRPHFHVIVWSDKPLSQFDFNRAWSYKCVKTGNPLVIRRYTGKTDFFYFRIGHVRVDDLVANGTLDWNALHPKNDKTSANFCFQYVAKYIGKSDGVPLSGLKYINRAWDLIPFNSSDADTDSFEYTCDVNSKNFNLNGKKYEKVFKGDFIQLVSPFFGSSRLYSIGKQYYLQNRERFAKADFSLPKFCGRDLVFPSYFLSLLEIERQPFRLSKVVFSGYTFVKGLYPDLLAYFQKFANDKNALLDLYYHKKKDSPLYFNGRAVTDYTEISRNGDILSVELLRSDGVPLHCRYSVVFDVFTVEVFNVHARCYDFYEYVERVDFCNYVSRLLSDAISRFKKNKPLIDAHYQLDCFAHQTVCDIHKKISSFSELDDAEKAVYRQLQDYLESSERWQLRYNQNHNSDLQ